MSAQPLLPPPQPTTILDVDLKKNILVCSHNQAANAAYFINIHVLCRNAVIIL